MAASRALSTASRTSISSTSRRIDKPQTEPATLNPLGLATVRMAARPPSFLQRPSAAPFQDVDCQYMRSRLSRELVERGTDSDGCKRIIMNLPDRHTATNSLRCNQFLHRLDATVAPARLPRTCHGHALIVWRCSLIVDPSTPALVKMEH